MLDIFNLKGKVAIVTGGNGGLGLGIARGLANAGAAVAIVGRNQDKLDSAYENLKNIGPKILKVNADVSKEDEVKRMVKEPWLSLAASISCLTMRRSVTGVRRTR